MYLSGSSLDSIIQVMATATFKGSNNLNPYFKFAPWSHEEQLGGHTHSRCRHAARECAIGRDSFQPKLGWSLPLKMVCEPQQLSLESVFKASSRYSEHIRNNQKPRKFHSEAVGSSEILACTGPISRNPLVTRSVGILSSC